MEIFHKRRHPSETLTFSTLKCNCLASVSSILFACSLHFLSCVNCSEMKANLPSCKLISLIVFQITVLFASSVTLYLCISSYTASVFFSTHPFIVSTLVEAILLPPMENPVHSLMRSHFRSFARGGTMKIYKNLITMVKSTTGWGSA